MPAQTSDNSVSDKVCTNFKRSHPPLLVTYKSASLELQAVAFKLQVMQFVNRKEVANDQA
jgi:hypothetical protein